MTTDALILGLRDAGLLKADAQTGRVWYFHRQRRRWYEKRPTWDPDKGRWRFKMNVIGTTVNRSRLLYLLLNGDAPACVDHRDGDRTNDLPSNLGPHARAESDRQGRDAQQRNAVVDAFAWFDYIARYGCEPPTLTDLIPS